MLNKLIREGNRITYEQNPTDQTDHFFNFSVTAHSIRDWCVKYTGQQSNKKHLNQTWDQNSFLAIAKDIANSTKHFGIDFYNPKVKDSIIEKAKIIDFHEGSNFSEKMQKSLESKDFRESEAKMAPSYTIRFSDDSEIELHDYVYSLVDYWIKYFDKNNIPRDQSINSFHLYLNRKMWDDSHNK